GLFAGKGSVAGLVVVPIHDEHDDLVAYAGRSVNGEEPRYKLPVGFKKSLVLYNFNRAVRAETPYVVVVEGFFDVMRVVEAGYISAVSLMGHELSDAQETLLLRFPQVILMMDGDEVGRRATKELVD